MNRTICGKARDVFGRIAQMAIENPDKTIVAWIEEGKVCKYGWPSPLTCGWLIDIADTFGMDDTSVTVQEAICAKCQRRE